MKTSAYYLDEKTVQHNISSFTRKYIPMKTSAYQHLSQPLVSDRMYNSYQSHISSLSAAKTYIMDKLTTVSPFLLMLIPVLAVMIYSFF